MNSKAKVDINKNRLYITIAGKAVKQNLDKLYTDVRFCVADLKTGFDVITDLSECSLGHLNGVPTYRKIMNFLITKKIGNVVRVIDENSLVFKQVMNITSRICGYKPIYVSTLEEAEKKLECLKKRNSIRFNINELPVDYVANETNGKGNIYSLSTSGCAIDSATLPVVVETEISIKFEFKTQGSPSGEFLIKSRVVRADGKLFAVKFKDLGDDLKDQLLKCLISEAQREL
ncbi:MAG: PilZ domain-containing protein [Desulfocapsaceae bacterium]|nr:PilZ domain-containing protein [Desulfocapsaceae bacterium]